MRKILNGYHIIIIRFILLLKTREIVKKIEELLTAIEEVVCDGKPSENWRQLDDFIRNVFSEGVIDGFKQRFLKHIRHHLITKV